MTYSRILIVLMVSCSSLTAFGQPAVAPVTPEVPRLSINVSPFVGMTFGLQCHASGNDTAQCLNSTPTIGVRLSPRWRVLDDKLGVGFSTSITWMSSAQGFTSTTWYDGQLGARYYFGQGGPYQAWVDATAGVMLAVERLPAYLNDVGNTVAKHSTSNWAPAASAALGYDAEMLHGFGLTPELRVSYFGLDHQGGILDYNPQTVVTLGLGLVGFGFHH